VQNLKTMALRLLGPPTKHCGQGPADGWPGSLASILGGVTERAAAFKVSLCIRTNKLTELDREGSFLKLCVPATPLDWGHFGELNSGRAASASASFGLVQKHPLGLQLRTFLELGLDLINQSLRFR